MNSGSRRPQCRFCEAPLTHSFVDLGVTPLANAYLTRDQLQRPEPAYPLHAYVCGSCFLVQLEAFETPENIFSNYAYYSSYSDTWLQHARCYAESVIDRFGIDRSRLVVELGSNDGYLLQFFKQRKIPVLGVEPAANIAKVAHAAGIPTIVRFFGLAAAEDLSANGQQADLLIGNNVLAHVPDLNGFVAGMKVLLKPRGLITMEFPHLLRLMEGNQFDTIYHEHFTYFSLLSAERVFARHGLRVFDVDELPTHGGSLRLYACHADDESRPVLPRVDDVKHEERLAGLDTLAGYAEFSHRAVETKRQLVEQLARLKETSHSIVGYGAAAKGNTLLNYCGIGSDVIDYVVDRNPQKQGLFLPGTHIPVLPPATIAETRPDYVLILPWNIQQEICGAMGVIRQWGGKFIVPIPSARVLP